MKSSMIKRDSGRLSYSWSGWWEAVKSLGTYGMSELRISFFLFTLKAGLFEEIINPDCQ